MMFTAFYIRYFRMLCSEVVSSVAERKNFKILISAGIILAVEVSILYFRPMRVI